mmetsp:Transcript_47999/g.114081  ORF Transcript_47999/g.114081 Transcript_47999/m.114081 type:complete len:929 (-) Transcript_47999:10-2796(-)
MKLRHSEAPHRKWSWMLVLLACLLKGSLAQAPSPATAAGPATAAAVSIGAEPCQVGSCGHGSCMGGSCVCKTGWAGSLCDLWVGAADGAEPAPQGCEDRAYCSQRGSCEDGLCVCHQGWTGIDCATEVLCPQGCNSPSGRCEAGVCVCGYGFRGDACEEQFCPHDCWGHGSCERGTCSCQPGWLGEQCGEADPSFHIATTSHAASSTAAPVALIDRAKQQAAARASIAARAAAAAADGFREASQRLQGLAAVAHAKASRQVPEVGRLLARREIPEVQTLPDDANATLVDVNASPDDLDNQSNITNFTNASNASNTSDWIYNSTPLDGLAPAASLAVETCPDKCNDHGQCKASGCACDDGWEGEACDTPSCPGGCSGRGMCLNGACVCHQSFYGEQCEYGRCLDDCSGNGYCDKGKCVCNTGFGGAGCADKVLQTVRSTTPWPQPHAVGWGKVQVTTICEEDCNGNGHCNSDGSCTCLQGFTGVACQDFCPNGCSGNGVCTDGHCVCLAGFSGPDCAVEVCCSGHGDCTTPETCQCSPGWTGPDCATQMVCPDPTCSGHGQCADGLCSCEAGWSGPVCAFAPAECGPCPAGGLCDRESRTCMCGGEPCDSSPAAAALPPLPGTLAGPALRGAKGNAGGATYRFSASPQGGQTVAYNPGPPLCNEPHGHWDDNTGSCQCQAPWFGEHCLQQHCPGFDEASGVPDCSAHGLCIAGQCQCATGWGQAPGSAPGPNTCADEVCPLDCGEHGLCKSGQCLCQHGWQGPTCRLPSCPHDCSGHGACGFTAPNSPPECTCDSGYALPDCAALSLAASMPSCPNDCSGNGLCMNGRCVCNSLFGGDDCNTMINATAQCLRDCSGFGLCFNGQCACDATHTGPDCSIPVQCLEACHDFCLPASTESEKCEFCKGQCQTLTMRGIMGRHSPLDSRFLTL